MAWSVIAGSAITGFNDSTPTMRVCIAQADFMREDELFNVTQSGNTDTYVTPNTDAVTADVYRAAKRWTYFLNGWGWYQTSADSGSNWTYVQPDATNMGLLSGALLASVQKVRVVRTHGLKEVTDTGDTPPTKVFEPLSFSYGASLEGHLESNETPFNNDYNSGAGTSITIPLGTGSVAAPMFIRTLKVNKAFQQGGPSPIIATGKLSGAVTKTTNPFSIRSWSATLDLDDGQAITGTVLLPYLQTDVDFATCGNVPFSFQGVFSGTVTFT